MFRFPLPRLLWSVRRAKKKKEKAGLLSKKAWLQSQIFDY